MEFLFSERISRVLGAAVLLVRWGRGHDGGRGPPVQIRRPSQERGVEYMVSRREGSGLVPRYRFPGSVDVLDDVDVSATFGCLFVVSGESGEGAVSTVTRDRPLYATLADGWSWNDGIERMALQMMFLLLFQLGLDSWLTAE